ncbi:MAG: 50S ribosomal protein L1 [Chloroflexi bacterium]|nr:50S ribosomal protein L1 [Chloroflexota bacterium]
MAKHGKSYLEKASAVDGDRPYPPDEAVELAKQTSRARFDETVELHLRTASDPRHADQLVRGVALLPHGLGRSIRVLVFAMGEAAITARDAGADYVGDDDMVKSIEEGWLEFDVAMATPDMMGRIGRLGRILGRRGLMPNPRTGTVIQPQDIPRAIDEAKKGRVEFRMDRTAIIHVPLGKVSFDNDKLLENMAALVDTVVKARPSAVKGQFIRTAYLTTTMGPSIKLDVPRIMTMRG